MFFEGKTVKTSEGGIFATNGQSGDVVDGIENQQHSATDITATGGQTTQKRTSPRNWRVDRGAKVRDERWGRTTST